MKKYIAIGGSAVAVIAGSAGYVLADSGPAPSDRVSDAIAQEGEQARSEAKSEKAKLKPEAAPSPAAKALKAKVKQVKIGASYEEAYAVLGAADWAEGQSTDFGNDVIYWYGGWAVYTSDAVVTSVTYYESEA